VSVVENGELSHTILKLVDNNMITSFTGTSQHKLDSKNRVCIPAEFRKWGDKDDNQHTFIVTHGLDTYLQIYPKPEWDNMIQELTNKLSPHNNPKHKAYIRSQTSPATTLTSDNQGRITIPQELREYAKIDKNVTFIGTINTIELWDTETYEQHPSSNLSPGDDYFQDIEEINI